MEKSKEILSAKLKDLIFRNEHMQKEIAKLIGINPKTFSTYVTGRCMPNFDTLVKIANFFGVDVEELVYGVSEKKEPDKALMKLFEQLDQEDKESILFMIKGMLQKEKYVKKEASNLA